MTSVTTYPQTLENTKPDEINMETEQSPSEDTLSMQVPEEQWVSLRFAHMGKEYTVDLADSDRYALNINHSDFWVGAY